MKRRWTLLLIAVLTALGSFTVVQTNLSTAAPVETDCWDEYTVSGGSGSEVQRVITPKGIIPSNCTTPLICLDGYSPAGNRNRVYAPHGQPKSFCLPPPPTTTTLPQDTTTTTSSTTTTSPGTDSGDFRETFDGNMGLDHFTVNVHHREGRASGSWSGDHDLNCGTPATQRTIHAQIPDESFYVCADHIMSSVGDVSGYSVGWFTPNQTFTAAEQSRVSWDVNVTDLGARQWWEVMIVPTSWSSGILDCEYCAVASWLSPSPSNLPRYPSTAIVSGSGPFGNDGSIFSGGSLRDPIGWQHICGSFAVDPEGCASKVIRRQFSITDNKNGTVTFLFLGRNYTYPGAFPNEYRVVFKDHNYTPDKDGKPQGHTWHWDNIIVD